MWNGLKWFLVPVVLAVALVGTRPDAASAKTPRFTQEDIKYICKWSDGWLYWRGDGSYGCFDPDSGVETACEANGNCETVCHERFGCDCSRPVFDVCVRIFPTGPRQPARTTAGADQQEVAPAHGTRSGPNPKPNQKDEDRDRNQQTR
jgi:hypothetical protein